MPASVYAMPVPPIPTAAHAASDDHENEESAASTSPNGTQSTAANAKARPITGSDPNSLKRAGDVRGNAVRDHSDEHEHHSGGIAAVGRCLGNPDEQDPEQADEHATQSARTGRRCERKATDHNRHQRHAAVQHARDRRIDPLLCDREQRQGECHPGHAQEGNPPTSFDRNRLPHGGNARKRERSEPDSQQGDEARLERLKPDRHKQERRAPDRRDDRKDRPIDRRHRLIFGTHFGGRRGHGVTLPSEQH